MSRPTNDLRSLSAPFQPSNWPELICPSCGRGSLSLGDKENFSLVESRQSQEIRSHEAWEPEWMHGTFHAELTCDRNQCGEVVITAGDWKTTTYKDDELGRWDGQSYEEVVLPRFFLPSLMLISPHENYPSAVCELVTAASTLLWTDPSAAANRLRASIEKLLDIQRIPKSFIDKKGKRQRGTTDWRIRKFENKRSEPAKFLMSVKWIGNSGSHEDSLTASDVIDAADLLEHALTLIYDSRPKQLAKRAMAINKRRGLPRKRK
ncbi:DUF4145 domain-containing protein [Streptomyces sp. R08]|uniref:DUF4145 domain-containing protein n=1 Tax=Streptomyces sp. R08 TaxID=3238624 RepID=A0AB39M3C2_9ACTN